MSGVLPVDKRQSLDGAGRDAVDDDDVDDDVAVSQSGKKVLIKSVQSYVYWARNIRSSPQCQCQY